jgi:hypothetical protein
MSITEWPKLKGFDGDRVQQVFRFGTRIYKLNEEYK